MTREPRGLGRSCGARHALAFQVLGDAPLDDGRDGLGIEWRGADVAAFGDSPQDRLAGTDAGAKEPALEGGDGQRHRGPRHGHGLGLASSAGLAAHEDEVDDAGREAHEAVAGAVRVVIERDELAPAQAEDVTEGEQRAVARIDWRAPKPGQYLGDVDAPDRFGLVLGAGMRQPMPRITVPISGVNAGVKLHRPAGVIMHRS